MPLAILADVHHGVSWRGRPRPDIIEAFRECIDIAIRNKVYALIIAGDLYNSSCPHPDSHAEVIAELDRLDQSNIDTYILMGNHDVQRKANALKPLSSVAWNHIKVITDDFVLKAPSYEVRMYPYRDNQPPFTNTGLSKFLGIGHAPVSGGMYEGTAVLPSNACLPKNLLDAAHHWFIGHIHTPQHVGNVVIPGAIVQSNISDAGQDRYLYLQHDLTDAPEKVKLTKGWKFVKYDLDFCTNKTQAKQQYRALLGSKLDDCDVCQVVIRLGMEDLGMIDLEALRKALKYKIVDIPAPVIVRKADVRLKSVQLETPRKQAVIEFVKATIAKDKVEAVLKQAERIMSQVDGK